LPAGGLLSSKPHVDEVDARLRPSSARAQARPVSAVLSLSRCRAGRAADVDLLLGAAAAGSASTFSVPDRAAGGTLSGAHAGTYTVCRLILERRPD
jgi:hypothetical protein